MCFSLEASFSAGVVLTVIGIATLTKVKHSNQLMFALIPLVFAIQQFIEGVLWYLLPLPIYELQAQYAAYLFVFIAHIVWPIWVPLSIYLFDQSARKNIYLKGLCIIGFAVSISLGLCALISPFKSVIHGSHILYVQDYPQLVNWTIPALYVLSTSISPMLSKIKGMKWLGIMILFSCLIAEIFFYQYALSVWCFFASLISIMVYFIMMKNNKIIKNV